MDSLPIKYSDFNKKVYDALLDKSNASSYVSTILLDIPLPEEKIKVPDNWSDIKGEDASGIPKYLGLIAIQVIVAADRKEDEDFTATAYNPRLCDYLDCNQSELSQRYNKSQEEIYESFAQWCRDNGLSLYIPERREGNWRFAQYPLALSLLNREHANELKDMFFNTFLQPLEYEYDFFWSMKFTPDSLPPYIKTKWSGFSSNRGALDNLKHQIYWHYLHWDGTGESPDSKKAVRKCCSPKFYWMRWSENADPSSAIFTENEEQIDVSRLPDKIKKGCFFIQDEGYLEDWELCSPETINPDADEGERHYAYVVVNAEDTILLENIRILSSVSGYSSGTLNIYTLKKSDIGELITEHNILFKKDPRIELEGGIRFRYQNTWLEGCGPEICKLNGYSEQFQLEKYDVSEAKWKTCSIDNVEQPLIGLEAGVPGSRTDYRLWYSEMRLPLRFSIKSIDRLDSQYPSGGGWQRGDNGHYSVASDNEQAGGAEIICGLDFSGVKCPDEMRRCNPARQWMDLVIGRDTNPSANENLIHKALRRSENGTKLCIR